jgi:hypothetical protein
MVRDEHDTADKVPRGSAGAGCAFHRTPSHRSASTCWVWKPTAIQAVVDGHETAARLLSLGAGPAWIFHAAPFHISIIAVAPLVVSREPTAKHRRVDGHDNPSRRAGRDGAGVG